MAAWGKLYLLYLTQILFSLNWTKGHFLETEHYVFQVLKPIHMQYILFILLVKMNTTRKLYGINKDARWSPIGEVLGEKLKNYFVV